jgi:hypothetical protein
MFLFLLDGYIANPEPNLAEKQMTAMANYQASTCESHQVAVPPNRSFKPCFTNTFVSFQPPIQNVLSQPGQLTCLAFQHVVFKVG